MELYYTLQEATEYLAKKHKKSSLDVNLIYKHIVKNHLPTYVYGYGFSVKGNYEPNLSFVNRHDLSHDALGEIEISFNNWLDTQGALLEIDQVFKIQLLFKDIVRVDSFIDILPISLLPKVMSGVEALKLYFRTANIPIKGIDYLEPRIEALFFDKKDNYFRYGADGPIQPEFKVRNIHEDSLTHITLVNIEYFEISIKDLVLTADSLEMLEQWLITSETLSLYESKSASKSTIKPKGKSKAKEEAQLKVRVIASEFWKNDPLQKIRVSEMIKLIRQNLEETQYYDQLPKTDKNLKEWFKEIIPDYASKSGRAKVNHKI